MFGEFVDDFEGIAREIGLPAKEPLEAGEEKTGMDRVGSLGSTLPLGLMLIGMSDLWP